jgi:hypothetical protein
LQEQVVALVSKRGDARSRLSEAHTAYLLAQGQFQAAEAELNGIEAEVQYRISLIAQLENRPAVHMTAPTLTVADVNRPNFGGISSEPTRQAPQGRQSYAEASADDLRAQVMRGSMM